MTAQAQDTGTAGKQTRRSDVGALRITQRDIDGFVLCAEHYGAPYDLLRLALRTSESGAKSLVYRWRRAGYVVTTRLGPGPRWFWLTKEGMAGAVSVLSWVKLTVCLWLPAPRREANPAAESATDRLDHVTGPWGAP